MVTQNFEGPGKWLEVERTGSMMISFSIYAGEIDKWILEKQPESISNSSKKFHHLAFIALSLYDKVRKIGRTVLYSRY